MSFCGPEQIGHVGPEVIHAAVTEAARCLCLGTPETRLPLWRLWRSMALLGALSEHFQHRLREQTLREAPPGRSACEGFVLYVLILYLYIRQFSIYYNMYACVYIHIYIYMYICIYVYMYICIYVYMYICICICVFIYIHTLIVCVITMFTYFGLFN